MLDYIVFVLPENGIEWLFFVVIFGLSIGTLLWLRREANEANWADRWEAGTHGEGEQDDDFDIAHGSIFELSDAVATLPERCAEVLPSMLLVIGLLGTFLGVGLSLDNASSVIQPVKDNNITSEVMNKQLNEMIQSLKGMGALFKSSIYGIICYLTFTLIRNAMGCDKKRLTWCIKHCYGEITAEKDYKNAVLKALENMSDSIGSSLEIRLSAAFKNVTDSFVQAFRDLSVEKDRVADTAKSVVDSTARVADSLLRIEENARHEFKDIADYVKTVGDKTEMLSGTINNVAPEIEDAAKSLSESVKRIRTKQIPEIMASIDERQKAREEWLREEFAEVRDELQEAIEQQQEKMEQANAVLNKMDKSIGKLGKAFEPILDQFRQTETELAKLSENLVASQDSVRDVVAATDPAKTFGQVDTHLKTVVASLAALQEDLKKSHTEMQTGFQSLAANQQDMKTAIEKNSRPVIQPPVAPRRPAAAPSAPAPVKPAVKAGEK